MQGITQQMTVRGTFPFLSPAQRINLHFWAAEFGLKLCEFHLGHIRTYENQRLGAVSREVVNAEVSTLLGLLDAVGAGDEIRRCYQPLREPDELSPEERAALPERALKYIEKLEGKVKEFDAQNYQSQNHLRKANWARRTR